MEITKSMSRVPLQEGSDFFSLVFPPQGKRWLITLGERGPTPSVWRRYCWALWGNLLPRSKALDFPISSVSLGAWPGSRAFSGFLSYNLGCPVGSDRKWTNRPSLISAPCLWMYKRRQDPTEQWPREGFKRASHTRQDPWVSWVLAEPCLSSPSPVSNSQASLLLSSPLLPPREKADPHLGKLIRSKGKKTPRKRLLRSKKIVFQNF